MPVNLQLKCTFAVIIIIYVYTKISGKPDGAECDLMIFKGTRCIAAIDAMFSPNPSKTRSMTIAVKDVKPLTAFYIVPEVTVLYS